MKLLLVVVCSFFPFLCEQNVTGKSMYVYMNEEGMGHKNQPLRRDLQRSILLLLIN
jgi:hypothetical protein